MCGDLDGWSYGSPSSKIGQAASANVAATFAGDRSRLAFAVAALGQHWTTRPELRRGCAAALGAPNPAHPCAAKQRFVQSTKDNENLTTPAAKTGPEAAYQTGPL